MTIMKKTLIALGLTVGGSALQAQNPDLLMPKAAPADTLLVLEEEALLRSLQQLADQLSTSETQVQVDQEDLMQVLRYQLMLNLLSPKDPAVVYYLGSDHCPQASPKSNTAQEVRLARIERMLEALMAEKKAANNKVTVVTKQPQAKPQAIDSTALKQMKSIKALEAKLAEAEARLKSLEATPKVDMNLPNLSLADGLTGFGHNAQTIIHATDTVQVTNRVEVATDFKRSVYFNVSSHQIDTLAARTLDEVVAFLGVYPEAVLVLNGYASPEGNAAYNKQLADRRLAAVISYLGSKGIDTKARLVSGTTGIDRTRSGFQLARRVDLSLKAK